MNRQKPPQASILLAETNVFSAQEVRMEESLNRSRSYRMQTLCAPCPHFFDEVLNTRKHRGDISREPHSSARALETGSANPAGGTNLAGKSCVPLLSKSEAKLP